MADDYPDVLLRSTSLLNTGDIVYDHAGHRTFEVVSTQSTVVNYWGQLVPVWNIEGRDTRTDLNGTRDVKTTCIARHRWEVIRQAASV